MLKLILLFLMAVVFVSVLSGQKNEISESEFLAKERFANDALARSNRKLVRTLEYFEETSKPGHLSERYSEEVLMPNRWRKVEEKDYDGKKTREERIWDGSALYVKQNGEEWQRFSGGASTGARIESGRITKTYR